MRQVVHKQTRLEKRVLESLEGKSQWCSSTWLFQRSSLGPTFLSLFRVLRYSRISDFPAYQGMCSKLDLRQRRKVSKEFKYTSSPSSNAPSPFTRRETSNPCSNCSVDEILLRYTARIRVRDNEREHGVHSIQGVGKLGRVVVVYLGPFHAWRQSVRGILKTVSVEQTVGGWRARRA